MTFGAEPKEYEVQEFINKHYYHLKFSPAIKTDVKDVKKNPKRAQRDAKKQTLEKGIGTKSQQALKMQQEQNMQQMNKEPGKASRRKLQQLREYRLKILKQFLMQYIIHFAHSSLLKQKVKKRMVRADSICSFLKQYTQ